MHNNMLAGLEGHFADRSKGVRFGDRLELASTRDSRRRNPKDQGKNEEEMSLMQIITKGTPFVRAVFIQSPSLFSW